MKYGIGLASAGACDVQTLAEMASVAGATRWIENVEPAELDVMRICIERGPVLDD